MIKKYKNILIPLGLACLLVAATLLINNKNYSDDDQQQKLEKVRVQAGWLLNGEFANVCSAIVNDYYTEEGLEVELVPGGPTGASFVIATNAIALDDSLTIGIDGDLVPLLRGKDQTDTQNRIKVKAFGAFWNENPYGFIVRTDSGIESIKDFTKRKPDGSKYKIGVTADSVIQFAIAKYLNVSVDELELVTVGFDATPLLANQVDALAGYWTTQAYELEKAGVDYRFISTTELPGFNQPSMIAMATEKTLSEKKDTLVKWMKATLLGVEFIKQNPDIAAQQILDPRCGGSMFDVGQEAWLIKKSLPLFDNQKPGWIYETQVTDFVKAYKALGQISHEPTKNDLIDYSILEEVY